MSAKYRDVMVTPFKQVAKWRYGLGVETFMAGCYVPYVGHGGAVPASEPSPPRRRTAAARSSS